MKTMQHFLNAVDWLSVKVTILISAPCFIIGNTVIVWLGIISVASNILYNGIRIYKELKK